MGVIAGQAEIGCCCAGLAVGGAGKTGYGVALCEFVSAVGTGREAARGDQDQARYAGGALRFRYRASQTGAAACKMLGCFWKG